MIADVADMTADVDAEVDNEMDVAVDLEMDAVEFDVAPDVNDADGEEAAFSCESDERRCSADRFQECNGDRAGWSDLGACLEGAVCIQGECVFLPDGYGDSCGEGDECPGDLLCSESICLSRVAGDIGDSCLDSLECEQPLWCNGLGQCTTGALDSPCAADSDCAGDAPLCEAGRICGQNTPPIIQTNGGLTLPQGAARTIGPEMLTSIDDEHGPQSLVYSITVFPTHGTMRLNGNEIDGGFTQSELDSGLLSYTQDGTQVATDGFRFLVSDPFLAAADEGIFDITIEVDNQAPTGIELSNTTVPENSGIGAEVGTLSTIDQEDGHSYQLVPGFGDDHNLSFQVVGDLLKTSEDFDHETQDNYTVRIRTTDESGLSYEDAFILSISDVNEGPTDVDLSPSEVAENSGENAVVGELSGTDPDEGDSLTFTLVAGDGDTNNGAFNLVGDVLRSSQDFDFEANDSYSIRVRATDNGGLWHEQKVVVTVGNVNEAPTEISLSATAIDENSGDNAEIGTLSASDPDSEDNAMFTLVSGVGSSDNGAFSIVGDSLRVNLSPDHEEEDTYYVRIRATDDGNLWHETAFIIAVADVNEAPSDIALSPATISENTETLELGILSATDPDDTVAAGFALVDGDGDTHNSLFTIIGSILRPNQTFDYETNRTLSVRVRATDNGGLWHEEPIVITVTNVNERPTHVALSNAEIDENDSEDALVGELSISDPETADNATFSLVSGDGDTHNDAFDLSGDELRTSRSFDYEEGSTRHIRVRGTDDRGLWIEEQFTITVADVNEAPAFTSTAVVVANPEALYSYSITTTDPDRGDTVTIELTTDSTWLRLTAGERNGTATLWGTATVDDTGKHQIRLSVADADGLTTWQQFDINVQDCPPGTISEGEACVLNLPADPSFADADAWVVQGGAEVSGDELNLVDAPLCSGAGATTTYRVASFDEIGPIRLDIDYDVDGCEGECAEGPTSAGLAVRFGDSFSLTPVPTDLGAGHSSLCLGEAAYGEEVSLSLGLAYPPMTDECVPAYREIRRVFNASMVVDDTCPAPGSVFNGDFETTENLGWELVGDVGVEPDTDNELALSSDGSRSGEGYAIGVVSVPSAPGQALSFMGTGETNDGLTLTLNRHDLFEVEHKLGGTGAEESYVQCLPESTWGTAQRFRLAAQHISGRRNAGDFAVDDFDVIQTAGCIPSAGGFINGDFEAGDATGWWTDWASNPDPENHPSFTVKDEDTNHFLHASFTYACASVNFEQSVVIPSGSNALRLRHRGSATTYVRIGASSYQVLDPAGDWTTEAVCLDPSTAGHPSVVSFYTRSAGGSCSAEDTSWREFDDIEFVSLETCD